MKPEDLTDDAKVILLLCGHFGKDARPDDGSAPLGVADYGRFSAFLHDRSLRPASLLDGAILDNLEAAMSPVPIPRVRSLLSRGAAMSFAVEGWMNKGLWVLCRSDADYPRRLKRQLREMAPPILFGAGDRSLLDRGGLAMVGSRNIGPEQETFASSIANRCASEGLQVVSGGARGVDQTAMSEALAAGGSVVGVLADSLLRTSLKKTSREALHDRRLALVSAVHPEAGFNVGAAMARNKFIYALADHALIVQAEFQKGGTWSGAVEELERPGGRPVFFRPGFSSRKTEDALSAMGALSFPEPDANQGIVEQLRNASKARPMPQGGVSGELKLCEEPAAFTTEMPVSAESESPPPSLESPEEIPGDAAIPACIFNAVWPVLRSNLQEPVDTSALAERLGVRKPQLDDWLKLALEAGLVTKLNKPTRYVLTGDELFPIR